MTKRAILALEDGRVFSGQSFGVEGTATGEVCFNTSMTGYQEILSDPSYRGQIVTMTYPMIGNYGVNKSDEESGGPQVRGMVVGELCEAPSNWRSDTSLQDYLAEANILGLEGVDTRALTKHLRSVGVMRACLTTELSEQEAVEKAKSSLPMAGANFVREVTSSEPHIWSGESRKWQVPNEIQEQTGNYQELIEPKYRIVAYDFGVKRNILRCLRQEGFEVELVPADTPAAEVLERKADGVFLSNGPGDPGALTGIHKEVKALIGRVPLFGICLGHQILTHAHGGQTYKLKFGHRGGNQPVKDLRNGKVTITSQNHGFATDSESLPDSVEITHVNLNDGTVEGMRSKKDPVFSVQYHPEAAPGPHDASYFFEEFAELIEEFRGA